MSSHRNKSRRHVKATANELRTTRRLRRRAEKAELMGYRPGKMAVKATRNGWWYS